MNELKWRFPGNHFGKVSGLDTPDTETFKKDAISSLAREICQNSIDAKRKGVTNPVKVVFKSFVVDRELIPGIDELSAEILNCMDTWKNQNKKLYSQLSDMYDQITKEHITCLRISDFNTTGLVGVSEEENSTWSYLIHGSGISDKGETSGGSKGIGKYATFVTSYFNTVFYSTATERNETGYEGLCKLCSSKMPGTTEKTQGWGYYTCNDKNEAIYGQFNLDPNFSRDRSDFGTDIYVIGFKAPNDWERDIISKILESFMSAIVYNCLNVTINNVEINSQTLKDVIDNDELINNKMKSSIKSQYLLLTDTEHRFEDTITIDNLGTAKLFLLQFNDENQNYATNNCVMIRYPYMKIKELKKISHIPCSAMCIIENNKLNSLLRNIENPQHTDWEFRRIDNADERAEVQSVYKQLINDIQIFVTNHLGSSDSTETDVEGAGEFIPGVDSGVTQNPNAKSKKIYDKPQIRKKKVKIRTVNLKAKFENENGNGLKVDQGEAGDDEEFLDVGEKEVGGLINNHKKFVVPGTESIKNDRKINKKSDLTGVVYRFFALDKSKYIITFTSKFDKEEAYLQLFAIDDSGAAYDINILHAKVNGTDVTPESDCSIKLKLKYNEKVTVELQTDQNELFSGEVKLYEYR